MKIIVPTDFSDLSKVALKYAAQYASYTRDPLILVNNAILEIPPRAGVLINLEEKLELNSIEDLKELAVWTRQQANPAPDVFCEMSKSHDSAQAIVDKTASAQGELIIMGTRGASGISGAILGSVSSEVVRKSSVPVILVPANAGFKTEGSMIFAINPDSPPPSSKLIHFGNLCNKFNKSPEFFISSNEHANDKINKVCSEITNTLKNSNCIFHKHTGDDPSVALREFTLKHPCMMLALDPTERTFFERILGKSVSTKMIANSTVPVVTFP